MSDSVGPAIDSAESDDTGTAQAAFATSATAVHARSPAPRASLLARIRGDGLLSVLARGAALAMLLQVAGIGLQTLMQVFLAREMGVEAFGAYSYAFSWIIILALLAGLGIPQMMIRYVAQYQVAGEHDQLAALLRFGRSATLLASLAISLAGIALLAFVRPDNLSMTAVVIAMVCILPTAQLTLQTQLARSLGRIALAYAPYWPLRYVAIIALSAALLVVTGALDTEKGLAALALGMAVVTLAQWWRLRLLSPATDIDVAAEPGAQAAWLRVSLTLLVVQAGTAIMEQGGVIIVGLFADSSDTGVYAAAARVALLASLMLVGFSTVVAPTLSRLYYQGRKEALQRTVTMVARASALFGLAALVGLGIFAEPVLGLFGDEFRSGAWVLRILLIGQLAHASTGPVTSLMNSTGHHVASAQVMTMTVILYVAMAAVLTYQWGPEGAAVAAAAARGLWNLIFAVLAYRRLGVKSFVI